MRYNLETHRLSSRFKIHVWFPRKRWISGTVIVFVCLVIFWALVAYIEDNEPYYVPSPLNEFNNLTEGPCMTELGCKRFYQTCTNREGQDYVKEAFIFAWRNYYKYSWGHDHLKPVSNLSDDDLLGLGATLVDSLTTILLLDLKEEFNLSKEWLKKSFILENSTKNSASLFEVVIRVIGALTSTYHLTADRFFLDKAKEVGEVALTCFKDGVIPHMELSFIEGTCKRNSFQKCLYSDCDESGDCNYYYCKSEVSEVGTLGLELRALSYATGDMRFAESVNQTSNALLQYKTWNGLVARYLYAEEERFVQSSDISTGPGTDSYYEYLLKQWIHSNFKADRFKTAYLKAVEGIEEQLMTTVRFRDKRLRVLGQRPHNLTLMVELHHLSCFLPGTLALGVYYGLPHSHLLLAEDIIQCCYYLYQSQPTGLAAELSVFKNPGIVPIHSENYLRPETVESLFILHRVTKKQMYRDMGWKIFQAFERTSRTCSGYTNVRNVGDANTPPLDKMESFFLAETLKYLYLLFEEDEGVLSWEGWVLNTEAHPLPIIKQQRHIIY